ncbi:MAG: UrcA family protein [Steroidobacteraceae bacterium]
MVPFKHRIPPARRAASAGAVGWLLAAAAGVVLLTATPLRATAAPAVDVPWVAVSYGDLNLATEHGTRTLLERIRSAANEVCARVPDDRDLARFEMHTRCVRQAIARAVRQVGNPHLGAFFSARTRHG